MFSRFTSMLHADEDTIHSISQPLPLLLLLHYIRLMAIFQDNLGNPAPETILDFTGVRDDRVAVASAGPHGVQLSATKHPCECTSGLDWYSPVLLLMYRCCNCTSITDWSLYSSIRSTNQWRWDSFLMARYRMTKVCGLSDVWSSINRSRHCFCGSFFWCRVRVSSAPKTFSWNRKSMMPAGLMLLTTVECIPWNFSFNNAFRSTNTVFHSSHGFFSITAVQTHTTLLIQQQQQQRPFYGPLSWTTRVSRYQKKHSPTAILIIIQSLSVSSIYHDP